MSKCRLTVVTTSHWRQLYIVIMSCICLARTIYPNTLLFFVKNEKSFCIANLFSTRIFAYLKYLRSKFNETLTHDVVNFQILGQLH